MRGIPAQVVAFLSFGVSLGASVAGCGFSADSPLERCRNRYCSLVPGRIEAEDYRAGAAGVAFYKVDPAEQTPYRDDGVAIGDCVDVDGAGFLAGECQPGDWLTYEVVVQRAGTYDLAFRVAQGGDNPGSLRVEIDDAELIPSTAIPLTGGWADNWSTVPVGPVSLPEGAHVLKIVWDGWGPDLNYIDVVQR